MKSELVHGFETELAAIKERIVDARIALDEVGEDDGEGAAICRVELQPSSNI